MATQFHPEKSQRVGLAMYANFARLNEPRRPQSGNRYGSTCRGSEVAEAVVRCRVSGANRLVDGGRRRDDEDHRRQGVDRSSPRPGPRGPGRARRRSRAGGSGRGTARAGRGTGRAARQDASEREARRAASAGRIGPGRASRAGRRRATARPSAGSIESLGAERGVEVERVDEVVARAGGAAQVASQADRGGIGGKAKSQNRHICRSRRAGRIETAWTPAKLASQATPTASPEPDPSPVPRPDRPGQPDQPDRRQDEDRRVREPDDRRPPGRQPGRPRPAVNGLDPTVRPSSRQASAAARSVEYCLSLGGVIDRVVRDREHQRRPGTPPGGQAPAGHGQEQEQRGDPAQRAGPAAWRIGCRRTAGPPTQTATRKPGGASWCRDSGPKNPAGVRAWMLPTSEASSIQ